MYFTQGRVTAASSNKRPSISAENIDGYTVQHMYCSRATHPAGMRHNNNSPAIQAGLAKEYSQLQNSRSSALKAMNDAHACPGLNERRRTMYGNYTGAHRLETCQELKKYVDGVYSYNVDTDDSQAALKYQMHSARIDCEDRNKRIGKKVHPIPEKLKVNTMVDVSLE